MIPVDYLFYMGLMMGRQIQTKRRWSGVCFVFQAVALALGKQVTSFRVTLFARSDAQNLIIGDCFMDPTAASGVQTKRNDHVKPPLARFSACSGSLALTEDLVRQRITPGPKVVHPGPRELNTTSMVNMDGHRKPQA